MSFTKKFDVKLDRPIVSFTFDDAPISAFLNGGSALSKFGFGGTFYISLSLMNGADPETRFTVQQLKDSVAQHNELGCHTWGHTDLYRITFEKGKADIEKNQTEIQALLPAYKLRNFSYPFGSQTLPIKKFVSTQFRSARGIEEGINTDDTDLYNLRTVKLYEKKYPLPFIFNKINEAQENNGWLIFYTHDVDEKYTDWGCSPAYFEAVVAECSKRGITVATVDEALNLIGNSNNRPANSNRQVG